MGLSMINIENELTVLDINKSEFINKLERLGATKVTDELLQQRYVYDFSPKKANKWIRLRTNGEKTTLTIKEIQDNSKMNAKEIEISVSDFETTNLLLEELGYSHRNYQENLRQVFVLNGVEISIDSWPHIPPYVELECKDLESINEVLQKLEVDKKNITMLDVTSIYKDIYGIDILSISELKFNTPLKTK